MSNSRLVYSTDKGRIRPDDKKDSVAGKQQNKTPNDGVVRVRRETSGRKGKGVTTITGIPRRHDEIDALAQQLKKRCATGGTVKEGVIEIQGDHRDTIVKWLQEQGFTVKLAGG